MRKIIIYLFFIAMVFLSRYEGYEQLLTRVLVPLFFLYSMFYKRALKPIFNASIILFLLFTLWSLTGALIVVDTDIYWRTFQRVVGGLLGLFFMVNILRKEEDFKNVAFAIGIGAMLGSVMSLMAGEEAYSLSGRLEGMYDNPNVLAFTAIAGLIFSFCYLLLSEVKYKNILYIGSSILFLLPIIYSASRKGLITYFIFLLLAFNVIFPKRIKYQGLFISLFIAAFLILSNAEFSIESDNLALSSRIGEGQVEGDATHRLYLITHGIQTAFKYPVLGVGLGNYIYYNIYNQMSHNDLVEALVTTGFVGFILYFLIIYGVWKAYRRRLKLGYGIANMKNSKIFKVSLLIGPFLAVFIILGLGKPHFIDMFYMAYLGYFIALLSNLKLEDTISDFKR